MRAENTGSGLGKFHNPQRNSGDLDRLITENSNKIDQNFLDMMNNIVNQVQNQKDQPELIEKVNMVYKAVLKHSMKKQMKANQELKK